MLQLPKLRKKLPSIGSKEKGASHDSANQGTDHSLAASAPAPTSATRCPGACGSAWARCAALGYPPAGFGISAAVYLLGMERYRPILRASILISFLGYCTVMVGYLYEIGLPWRFWHPIVMWNSRSVLFDVCVCIMTYFTVLMSEFAPAVIEKLPWKKLRESILHYHPCILIGVVLGGVLLSSMQRSFLGGPYLIAEGKVHPLWLALHARHVLFVGDTRRTCAHRDGNLPLYAFVERACGFQHPQ